MRYVVVSNGGYDMRCWPGDVQTDAYQATGCYNLLCSGFVQTSNEIAIGAAVTPVSSIDSSQYDIRILIWKVSVHPSSYKFWDSLISSALDER